MKATALTAILASLVSAIAPAYADRCTGKQVNEYVTTCGKTKRHCLSGTLGAEWDLVAYTFKHGQKEYIPFNQEFSIPEAALKLSGDCSHLVQDSPASTQGESQPSYPKGLDDYPDIIACSNDGVEPCLKEFHRLCGQNPSAKCTKKYAPMLRRKFICDPKDKHCR